MRYLKSAVVLWGVGFLMACILSGCSTVHGMGEDLDTLGRGISNDHSSTPANNQNSSQK